MEGLEIIGLDCHIGSQLTELAPFVDALDRVLALTDRLKADGITLRHLDLGGGLGITYRDETPPQPAEYASTLLEKLKDTDYEIILEPGRAIMGNAGILLTTVEFLKHGEEKNFAIVDAAMNDLMRPALYQAWQTIEPVVETDTPAASWDIVGPICETGDFLGKGRLLSIQSGDILCIRSTGAYGFAMASQYNSRPRAIEVMVDGGQVHIIRERETIESLYSSEHIIS